MSRIALRARPGRLRVRTINLHLYRNRSGHRPVPATVIVRVKSGDEGPLRMIAERRVELTQVGEELTVVRFELGDEGRLVPGSIHDLQRALRSARRG